jgi:hypothetical protein
MSAEWGSGSLLERADQRDLEDELQRVYSRDHFEYRGHHIFTDGRQQHLSCVLHPFQTFKGGSLGPEVHSLIPLDL